MPIAAVAATVVGSNMAKQAQSDAKNAAQAEQQRAQEEQQRLEGKYGTLTPEEQDRAKANYELSKSRQAEYERRAGLSGEELLSEGGSLNPELINKIRKAATFHKESDFPVIPLRICK